MRRAIISILLILALLSSIPVLAHRDDDPPSDAMRKIAPEVVSRGFTFAVTIAFTAPGDDVLVDEGNGGADWFVPGDQDGFLLFEIVGFEASPTPESFDGRGLWVWDDDDFDRGDPIHLVYSVLVDAAVEYGVYRVLGSVGLEDEDDRATVKGDSTLEVAPPTVNGTTDAVSYEPGDQVAFRAAVRYPDGSPGASGTVLVHIDGKNPVVLEESDEEPGLYLGRLTLAPDETPGSRLVRYEFTDDKGNVAQDLGSFEVLAPRPPPTLTVIAMPLKPVFNTSEPVVVRAEASVPRVGPASGANLTAIFNRTAGAFPMEELAPGLYEVVLGPTTLTGTWEVLVLGSLGNATGSDTATFEVVVSTEPPPPPPPPLPVLTVQANASETDYERLENVSLHAETRLDGLLASVSQVRVSLLGLGQRAFVRVGVGQYELSFGLPEDFPLGLILLEVEALSNGSFASTQVGFAVHPTPLSLAVEFDRAAYEISENARLTVTATYRDARFAEVRGVAFVQPTETAIVLTRGAEGVLSGSFEVPPGAPLGVWNVLVEVQDPYGNKGVARAEAHVVPATFAVGLIVGSGSVTRLAGVDLRVDVRYPSGSPVEGAQVALSGPAGELLLEGAEAGIYKGRLLLARDFPLGVAQLTARAMHRDGQGEDAASLLVEAASLGIQINLGEGAVRAGESLRINVTATYDDGQVLTDGVAKARILDPGGALVTQMDLAFEAGSRAFTGLWRTSASVVSGTYVLEVDVEDPFGNSGHGRKVFRVEGAALPPDGDIDRIAGVPILLWAAVLILAFLAIAAVTTYAIRLGGG